MTQCEGINKADSSMFREVKCDRSATVTEPAIIDQWSYADKKIVERPNVDWQGKSREGMQFCGTHSPSRKATREASKRASEYADDQRQAAAYDAANARFASAIAHVESLCQTDEDREALAIVKRRIGTARRHY